MRTISAKNCVRMFCLLRNGKLISPENVLALDVKDESSRLALFLRIKACAFLLYHRMARHNVAVRNRTGEFISIVQKTSNFLSFNSV